MNMIIRLSRIRELAYFRVRENLDDAFKAGQCDKPFNEEISALCAKSAFFAELAEKQRLAGMSAQAKYV